MLDHLGVIVRSSDDSKRFYTATLAPLGYGIVEEHVGWTGYGPPGKPLFWIGTSKSADRSLSGPIHIAFTARDRTAVAAFYAAAIEAGAVDKGRPGLRPEYHPNYFGAFVIDPDGNNIEAVCHDSA
jgi:catechol 2,3-dioxygenase-like lactoylglutathione lyase family enzyme